MGSGWFLKETKEKNHIKDKTELFLVPLLPVLEASATAYRTWAAGPHVLQCLSTRLSLGSECQLERLQISLVNQHSVSSIFLLLN